MVEAHRPLRIAKRATRAHLDSHRVPSKCDCAMAGEARPEHEGRVSTCCEHRSRTSSAGPATPLAVFKEIRREGVAGGEPERWALKFCLDNGFGGRHLL
jgi:hypothetical protein